VSVGAYDVVKEALSSIGDSFEEGEDAQDVGGHVEFRKLAMQPGKPQGSAASARTARRCSRCPATR
jgi:molybdopterin molybdotransferase